MGRGRRRNRVLQVTLILATLVAAVSAGGLYFFSALSGNAVADDHGAAAPADAAGAEPARNDRGAGEDDEADDDRVPVDVAEVAVGDVSTYISATANLVPEDEVRVLSEAEGRITSLLVEEGDRVRAGDVLAELHRDEAEILVNKARLTAENARMAYERASRMHAEQLIAQEEYDKATMDHRIAQQELAEAEWQLQKTQIRAPFDGRITARGCTLGQNVRPGDELFTVTDFTPLIARIYLPEKDVLRLDEGREVHITLKADESVRFTGRIRQISPVVDTATGTVKVTVEAVDPPPGVRPGGFVAVDITRETHTDTMLLPKEAVIRELKSAYVFVADGDVADRRDVKLGLEEGARIEILSGLERGERVVVAGQGSLDDGAKIKVLSVGAETRASNAQDDDGRPARG